MAGHNSRDRNHSVSVKAYLRSVNCVRSKPLNDGQPIGSAVIGQRYANMALASASVSDRNSTHASVTAGDGNRNAKPAGHRGFKSKGGVEGKGRPGIFTGGSKTGGAAPEDKSPVGTGPRS